jgi:D-serine deaminase-like pyridoxal phosphate-dependent protein
MSRPAEDRAIVDAGLKALAFDSGPPMVCDKPAATCERASDEHGRLTVSAATNRLGLGDKIRLIPAHCDPTVNPHPPLPRERGRVREGAWYVCVRAGRVEQVWRSPLEGRCTDNCRSETPPTGRRSRMAQP